MDGQFLGNNRVQGKAGLTGLSGAATTFSTSAVTLVIRGKEYTLAGVVLPTRLQGQARIGLIFGTNNWNATGIPTAGNFVGGTTALDAANTNVVYVSPTGSFDQSIVL